MIKAKGSPVKYLPIIPDPIIELIKLKDADIIELRDFLASFCRGINVVPSSEFNWNEFLNEEKEEEEKIS